MNLKEERTMRILTLTIFFLWNTTSYSVGSKPYLPLDIAEKIIKKDLSNDSSQKKYVEDLIKDINKSK